MSTEKKVRKVTKKTIMQIDSELSNKTISEISCNSLSEESKKPKKPKEPKQPKELKKLKEPKLAKKQINEEDNQDDKQENNLDDKQEHKEEVDYEPEQKIPKKRGRKPKGGKIIKQNIKPDDLPQEKPNIILHLKCCLSDIKDKIFPLDEETYNPVITESIDGYAFNASKDSLVFDYIKQQVDDTKSDDVVYYQKPKSDVINTTLIQNPHTIAANSSASASTSTSTSNVETDSLKDIWKKLSILEQCLHNNDISDKKSACFWCTCDFDNPPIFIPKYELNNSYHVYGCFCSPECSAAYLMKENIDQASKIERYALLNHIYCKIYAYEKNIKPAPSPFYTLNKYYGNLTIQEYRKLLKNERLLLIVDKPLTRQLPELHQDNDDFIINTNTIPSASKYKIKRTTKQSKSSIVSENFGSK